MRKTVRNKEREKVWWKMEHKAIRLEMDEVQTALYLAMEPEHDQTTQPALNSLIRQEHLYEHTQAC